MANEATGTAIATSSSGLNGIVGMGRVALGTLFGGTSDLVASFAVTVETGEEQNPYTAQLAARAMTLKRMPSSVCYRHITIVTRNLSALAANTQPRQQSGQGIIT